MRGVHVAGFALVAGCGFSANLTGDAGVGSNGSDDGSNATIDAPPANSDWWDA
jgi:hypothetical protein